MPASESEDPRPLFRRAADQAEHLAGAVHPDQLFNPTPCAEYDVRALLGHLVAVLRKVAHVGVGKDADDIPAVIDGVADESWVNAIKRARSDLEAVWAEDEVLDRTLELPWATLPGRAVLDAYTHELTVHSWDLAHATGRLAQLDHDLGDRALDWFTRFVPPDSRGEQAGFQAVVSVPDDTDVYSRLAAFTGRRP